MPASPSNAILSWDFPLPRTHTGILLGNGTQGLMVWGESTLNVTTGRAGFWDHRRGKLCEVRITCLAGGPLELVHGLGSVWKLNGKKQQGPRLSRLTYPGERLTLSV